MDGRNGASHAWDRCDIVPTTVLVQPSVYQLSATVVPCPLQGVWCKRKIHVLVRTSPGLHPAAGDVPCWNGVGSTMQCTVLTANNSKPSVQSTESHCSKKDESSMVPTVAPDWIGWEMSEKQCGHPHSASASVMCRHFKFLFQFQISNVSFVIANLSLVKLSDKNLCLNENLLFEAGALKGAWRETPLKIPSNFLGCGATETLLMCKIRGAGDSCGTHLLLLEWKTTVPPSPMNFAPTPLKLLRTSTAGSLLTLAKVAQNSVATAFWWLNRDILIFDEMKKNRIFTMSPNKSRIRWESSNRINLALTQQPHLTTNPRWKHFRKY